VYVGSSDSTFYAIAAETGKVAWTLDVEGAVSSSAAIDELGRLYFATDVGVVYQVVENVTYSSER
jgi:outer membrane protein assembly factor BamB